jgi:hypothetical protein
MGATVDSSAGLAAAGATGAAAGACGAAGGIIGAAADVAAGLSALAAEFPGYEFSTQQTWEGVSLIAVRQDGSARSGIYAVITADLDEMRRALLEGERPPALRLLSSALPSPARCCRLRCCRPRAAVARAEVWPDRAATSTGVSAETACESLHKSFRGNVQPIAAVARPAVPLTTPACPKRHCCRGSSHRRPLMRPRHRENLALNDTDVQSMLLQHSAPLAKDDWDHAGWLRVTQGGSGVCLWRPVVLFSLVDTSSRVPGWRRA